MWQNVFTTPVINDSETIGEKFAMGSSHAQCAPIGRGGRRNSAATTAGLIVADVVGVGVLSMAKAVSLFGWFLGPILIVMMFVMNIHISLLMWRVYMSHPEANTYMELVASVFEDVPERQRRLIVTATGALQYTFIFSQLGLVILCCGKGLGMIFYHVPLCLPVWALIGCALVLPFHMTARKLGTWKSLIGLNVATILGSCVIPLVYMAWQGVAASRVRGSSIHAIANLEVADSLTGLSTMCFAFTSQFMLVEIMSEMKSPAELPSAYMYMSAPFQLGVFLTTGVVGYYFRGEGVAGLIVNNIPFGLCFRFASVCLVAHMVITYVIKGTVVCSAIHSALDPAHVGTKTPRVWVLWTIIVMCALSSSLLVSQVIPFFEDLIEVLGASISPLACWVIPIIMYCHLMRGSDGKGGSIGPAEASLLSFELALAVVLCLCGTWIAVMHILDHWHTYGYPFDCHCEDIWNTCSCSATHPGIDSQCAAVHMQVKQPSSLQEWGIDGAFVSQLSEVTSTSFIGSSLLTVARNATVALSFHAMDV